MSQLLLDSFESRRIVAVVFSRTTEMDCVRFAQHSLGPRGGRADTHWGREVRRRPHVREAPRLSAQRSLGLYTSVAHLLRIWVATPRMAVNRSFWASLFLLRLGSSSPMTRQ